MTTVNSAAKTIILVAPQDMGISDLIAKNLSHCGFTVIKYERPAFQYKNFFERMVNFFRKLIFRDFSYKAKNQDREGKAMLLDFLHQHKQIDYMLTIRPDMFSDEFLSFLQEISNKKIGYQWDGLDRFPDVFSKIHFFDNFFVFDPADIQKYHQYDLQLITNFYFDYTQKNQKTSQDENKPPKAYFVGSHLDQRTPTLLKMLNCLHQSDIEPMFLIAGISGQQHKQSEYKPYSVTFLDKNISFEENLANVESADIVVDILNDVHGGLSFRAFEALYYTKKLITNNTNITQYDFYDDHNILIWTDHITPEEIQSFLKKPYRSPNQEIIYKYSFTNWIHYMLGIRPFIALDNCLRQTTTTHIKQ